MQETETPPGLAPAPPAAPPAADARATRSARRQWPAPLRRLWQARAAIAGLIAILLAVWAESLMRTSDQAGGQAALGTNLLRVAVLLVGLVAWVRDGWHLGAARRGGNGASAEPGADAAGADPLPVRRAGDGVRVALAAAGRPRPGALRAGLARAQALRARLGPGGTLVGLLIVAALTTWCILLLRQDFSHPLAPWVWLAALVVLVATFLGLEPAKSAPGLLPHDPGEPAAPPPVSRGEWLAIGAIMLVAAVVRLWNLDTIPMGPYTDEGDRAVDARHINHGELVNQAPFVLFGTGWWGVPSLYFWLVAQSLKAFGDNLGGARMIHALAGITTVWYTYRLGRAVWSPQAGLLAAGLLAVSDFAIQFSRTAGESTITLLTWTACFYYLYRALQTRRPLDFVLSGLAGGFTLYGYVAGKLLPVFMVLVAVYVLLRWRWTGLRRYLPGLVLLALTAALVYAPNGLYVLSHPDTFTARYNGVSIFTPSNANALYGTYQTTNWGAIIAQQFGLTYSAFDVGQERGPFYPTHEPILPVVWAALWVLGSAYLLWRVGDVRFAVLGIWILSGLAGAALTNGTPTMQRVAGMVPTLALVPAIFLDRVARGVPPVRWGIRLPPPARAARWALSGLTAFLVLVLGVQTLGFYFGPYTAAANYYWWTLAGRYAEKLDPAHNAVYQMDVPEFFWWSGPALFLANQVAGRDLANVGDELPLTTDNGKNAHFLVFPSNEQYLALLQSYYPGGQEHTVTRPEGGTFFTAYEVDQAQFDARRQVRARYGPAGGPLFERTEQRLGTLAANLDAPALRPPARTTYPTRAEWTTGLRVPAYGTYRLNLIAPAGATLTIDGRAVLTATAGSEAAVESRWVLAGGVHQVRLTGTLSGPDSPVELRWSTDTGVLVPVAPAFLWSGPPGSLLLDSYNAVPPPNWLTTAQAGLPAGAPAVERRDGALGWRSVNDSLNGGNLAVWRGTLHAAVTGAYGFRAATDAATAIFVDGQLLDRSSGSLVPALPSGVGAPLSAGDHNFELRVALAHPGTPLDVFWLPPGGTQAVLTPDAFAPATGGVYTVDERPGVPSPDPNRIGAGVPALGVRLAGVISGDWQEARGVAVLPDGRVVVGDGGHHRVLVYGADGHQQAAWGSAGQGDGHFGNISDLATNAAGQIAVLDPDNGDVQLFAADGTPQGHLTQAQLGLQHSSGIAWGPDGRIYVADTAGARVVRSTPDGQQVGTLRDADATHAPLDQALDVVVTPDGTVYADDLRGRVVRFNAAGQIDREWSVPIGANLGGSHLALWGPFLAITNPDSNALALLDLTSGVLNTVQVDGPPLGLSTPVGVAAGPDNRLYVLDSGNNRVVVLAPETGGSGP